MNVDELVHKALSLYSDFNADNYDEKELVYLKAEVNNIKSLLYLNIYNFNSKAECFLHINNLNSLLEVINFEMDYKTKLLKKIREKLIATMNNEEWSEFLAQCKNEL